jgi:AcrR family transcriptional regulator
MSPGVITYNPAMARWQPDAHGRLQAAALELFETQGYEATTVAEIAARAGLTKRTFFRYFGDKREVLFAGSDAFERSFLEGIEAAPSSAAPLAAIGAGLDGTAALLQGRSEVAPRRQAILDANPELQERERAKLARLAGSGAEALRARGVADPAASLAAEAGIAVLHVAFARWVEGGGKADLAALLRDSLAELRALAAATAG